jgi:hypothetical protein
MHCCLPHLTRLKASILKQAVIEFKGGESVALERVKYYLWDSNLVASYFTIRSTFSPLPCTWPSSFLLSSFAHVRRAVCCIVSGCSHLVLHWDKQNCGLEPCRAFIIEHTSLMITGVGLMLLFCLVVFLALAHPGWERFDRRDSLISYIFPSFQEWDARWRLQHQAICLAGTWLHFSSLHRS